MHKWCLANLQDSIASQPVPAVQSLAELRVAAGPIKVACRAASLLVADQAHDPIESSALEAFRDVHTPACRSGYFLTVESRPSQPLG